MDREYEAAKIRLLLIKALERMKLINGPDENCCLGKPLYCPNHSLIHEIEETLTAVAP